MENLLKYHVGHIQCHFFIFFIFCSFACPEHIFVYIWSYSLLGHIYTSNASYFGPLYYLYLFQVQCAVTFNL